MPQARTSARLHALLHAIGWSRRVCAGRLGCDERTMARWLAGTTPAPNDVLEWLEAIADAIKTADHDHRPRWNGVERRLEAPRMARGIH